MSLFFYITLGVFLLSLIIVGFLLGVKVYEQTAGRLLFSRKRLEKADDILLRFFKKADKQLKYLALLSARRKAFKLLRLGKLKHFFNKTRKVTKKIK